jgi:hypothetical protein
MAIHGVSLSEREAYVLDADPAKPENITKAVKDRADAYKRSTGIAADTIKLEAIEADVRHEAGAPTVFYTGNLSRADRIEIGDMTVTPTMKDNGITMNQQRIRKAYTIVARGLKGWDNMLDSDGNVARFELSTAQVGAGFSATVSDDCLSLLTQENIQELATRILIKNGMQGELEKNLDAASQQLSGQALLGGAATPAPTIKNESAVAQTEPNPPLQPQAPATES